MPSRRRPSRRLLVLAGVVVVAGGGGTAWWLTRPDPAAAQAATMTVTRETFKDTVSASGTIEPATQADLSFAVSGTVTKVLVHAGQKVKKGDVLATVDDSLLASDVTAKESALEAARTRLSDDEDASASDTQLSSDRAQVVNAETQLAQARDALRGSKLRSTITGTVAEVNLSVGDTVGAAQGGESGTGQFSVVSSQRYVVNAEVATGDIDRVKKGLQVEVTPTGATQPVYGTVTTVGLVASAQNNGAATFPITIDITGRHQDVYAGSSATVQIIVKQVDEVLAVPSMALHQNGTETYVYKLVDGLRVKTPIKTGQTFGVQTEVTSGLKEGDTVEIISFARAPGSGTGQGGNNLRLPPGGVVFQDGGPGTDIKQAP
jgi:RND family efflux transporter MFP subunit